MLHSLPATISGDGAKQLWCSGDAGLVAQQQCCGPLQIPVADVAVAAQSHFGLTGAATSIGERPLMGLINPAAMARMALGESLTNLMWPRQPSWSM